MYKNLAKVNHLFGRTEALLHTSYSANLEAGSDLSWQSSLRTTQHDIEEFLRRRDRLNILPSSLHCVGSLFVSTKIEGLGDEKIHKMFKIANCKMW